MYLDFIHFYLHNYCHIHIYICSFVFIHCPYTVCWIEMSCESWYMVDLQWLNVFMQIVSFCRRHSYMTKLCSICRATQSNCKCCLQRQNPPQREVVIKLECVVRCCVYICKCGSAAGKRGRLIVYGSELERWFGGGINRFGGYAKHMSYLLAMIRLCCRKLIWICVFMLISK